MATTESATRVVDGGTGDFIATRDAIIDEGSNPRKIGLSDYASRQMSTHPTIRSAISADDTLDLDSLGTTITDNLIVIGDTSMFVIDIEHSQSDGSVTITPILFNSAGTTAFTVRESKTSAMGSILFMKTTTYCSPQLQWESLGAVQVGLHISNLSSGNTVTLKGGSLAVDGLTSS